MENKELGNMTAGAMIIVALFFDGLQFGADLINFIPFVGFILAWVITSGISLFAFMTFSLWFRLLEIKFNTKIVATTAGAFFIELIPVLNALPAWTLSIVLIMLMQKSKKVLGKVAPEVSKIVDKNTGGISKSLGTPTTK